MASKPCSLPTATSATADRISVEALNDVDLVLLDITSFDAATHMRGTGSGTDVGSLARFVATLDTVDHVEMVPCHQMGRDTWSHLSRSYPLADTEPPDLARIARARAQFEAYGNPLR